VTRHLTIAVTADLQGGHPSRGVHCTTGGPSVYRRTRNHCRAAKTSHNRPNWRRGRVDRPPLTCSRRDRQRMTSGGQSETIAVGYPRGQGPRVAGAGEPCATVALVVPRPRRASGAWAQQGSILLQGLPAPATHDTHPPPKRDHL
jgi:hypothetical protein